jgi:hypothetical protein
MATKSTTKPRAAKAANGGKPMPAKEIIAQCLALGRWSGKTPGAINSALLDVQAKRGKDGIVQKAGKGQFKLTAKAMKGDAIDPSLLSAASDPRGEDPATA